MEGELFNEAAPGGAEQEPEHGRAPGTVEASMRPRVGGERCRRFVDVCLPLLLRSLGPVAPPIDDRLDAGTDSGLHDRVENARALQFGTMDL